MRLNIVLVVSLHVVLAVYLHVISSKHGFVRRRDKGGRGRRTRGQPYLTTSSLQLSLPSSLLLAQMNLRGRKMLPPKK
jgi:hypothetical protein